MELKELAKEIIRYGECIYDKDIHNTRIQHFLYNNNGYEVIRQNGEFLVIKLIPECVKKQKQLKLIQDYLIQEVAPKVLEEVWQLENGIDIYDFAELIDYIIRNKVAEDETYKLMDKIQGVME